MPLLAIVSKSAETPVRMGSREWKVVIVVYGIVAQSGRGVRFRNLNVARSSPFPTDATEVICRCGGTVYAPIAQLKIGGFGHAGANPVIDTYAKLNQPRKDRAMG